MSAAKHRFAAILSCFAVAALMGATFATGHPLDLTDHDHDGYKNWADNCPNNYNPKQQDNDGDTRAPVANQPAPHPSTGPVIVYPYTPPAPQEPPADAPTDQPPNEGGDSCDIDDDNDDVTDNPKRDNCPRIPNSDQADSDYDGRGDACDPENGTASAVSAGVANPDDMAPPAVKVSAPRAVRYGAMGRGPAIAVRCSEACSLDGQLVVRKKPVARGAAQVAASGRTWVFLRFAKGTLSKLQRKGRAAATFKLAAKDAGGNRAAVSKRIVLRR